MRRRSGDRGAIALSIVATAVAVVAGGGAAVAATTLLVNSQTVKPATGQGAQTTGGALPNGPSQQILQYGAP